MTFVAFLPLCAVPATPHDPPPSPGEGSSRGAVSRAAFRHARPPPMVSQGLGRSGISCARSGFGQRSRWRTLWIETPYDRRLVAGLSPCWSGGSGSWADGRFAPALDQGEQAQLKAAVQASPQEAVSRAQSRRTNQPATRGPTRAKSAFNSFGAETRGQTRSSFRRTLCNRVSSPSRISPAVSHPIRASTNPS